MKLKNFSNAAPLSKVRYGLIKLLAGRSLVLINAKISLVEQPQQAPLQLNAPSGAYVTNCTFPNTHGLILHIEPREIQS